MTEQFFVADTHPLIYYFCGNQSKLSKNALAAFNSATGDMKTVICVPPPTIWEVSMLVEKNKIALSKQFTLWVDELFMYRAIIPCPFDVDTVKLLNGLNFNGDPFDKAIVATALQQNLPLITKDSKMHEHKPCLLYWD